MILAGFTESVTAGIVQIVARDLWPGRRTRIGEGTAPDPASADGAGPSTAVLERAAVEPPKA